MDNIPRHRSPSLRGLRGALRRYFAAAPGSIENHLNVEELKRTGLAALAAGGGLFGLLQGVVMLAGGLFPAPVDAALATLVFTLICEAGRRLRQGEEVSRVTRRSRSTR